MLNYLQQDAHDHVWGSPRQDNQFLFKLGRLSKNNGVNVSFVLNGENLILPNNTDKWHVFNIGGLNPEVLNLEQTFGQFKNIIEVMELNNIFIDCFTLAGYQLSKSNVYYNYTYNKDLIFAIKDSSVINIKDNDVWFRVYYSALFKSDILATVTSNIQVFSKKLSNNVLLQQAKDYYTTRIVQGGNVFVYKNGYLCDINSVALFDNVDIVHDASIKTITEVDYGSLNVFISEKDNVRKYVLHYPGGVDQLTYFDDIDVYVVGYTGSSFKGLLYSRADVTSLTQLTFKDFSLKTVAVDNIITELGVCDSYKIRLIIRDSGIRREIFDERRRLISLYELSDKDIKSTLGGFDSNIDEWKPENLEQSSFSKFVGTTEGKIQFQDVNDLYGYYTSVYRLSPSQIPAGIDYTYLPEQFSNEVLVCEYDKDGLYLGSYNHKEGYVYTRNNEEATTLELISGEKNYSVVQYRVSPVIVGGGDYRVYLINNGSYIDVTGDNNYYSLSNNLIVFKTGYNLVVRFRKDIYEYRKNIVTDKSIIIVNLDTNISLVGYGESNVYLNGYSLIKNINYFISGYTLYIYGTSKIVSGSNKIVARFSDFPGNYREQVVGFTSSGLLQTGNAFNFLKDREIRMILDGKLVKFDPMMTNVYSDNGDLENNLIFSLSPYYQNIKPYTGVDNYTLQKKDDGGDQKLAEYITFKNAINSNSAFNLNFTYVSPFMVNVIGSVLNNSVIEDNFSKNYNDYKVVEYCEPYESFLNVDLTISETLKYIKPSVIAYYEPLVVDVQTYNFIERLGKIYFPNQPNLLNNITVEVF